MRSVDAKHFSRSSLVIAGFSQRIENDFFFGPGMHLFDGSLVLPRRFFGDPLKIKGQVDQLYGITID
jgi:hypothetical protein